MKNIKQRKAFTVVEMVIVIAVIAILATVLIPTISGVIQKANHSTDVQFAASLNIQLALWEVDNGAIESEDDLRNAINEYYGAKDENGELLRDDQGNLTPEADYYSTLSPKSGKYGYHFWYDVENKQVVVAKYDELLPDPADPAPTAEETKFNTATLRCLTIGTKYYLFMDQAGSEFADVISGFEVLADAQDYEDRINAVKDAAADEDNEENGAYTALEAKLAVTTIVTDGGAFRYNDLEKITQVLVSSKATVLQQTKVFVYDGSVVNDGNGDQTLAKADVVKDIVLPANVKVSLGGLNALFVDTYTNETTRDYANTTKLHVNVTDEAALLDIFTDCVIVMPNGARYIYQGTTLYKLPIIVNDNDEITNENVGEVNSGVMGGGEVSFGIECNEVSPNRGEGKAYFSNNILYVAYDKGTVQLSLTGGVTNGMVNWSASSSLATVDGTGLVTLTLPEVKEGAVYSVDVTAEYKYNTANKETITIFIVRPISAEASLVGTVFNDTDKGSVTISYDGTNPEHSIVLNSVTNNDGGYVTYVEGQTSSNPGYVALDKGTLEVTLGTGNLFTEGSDNKLTINAGNIKGESSQDVTVAYKLGTVTYFEKTFTITVKDNSSVGLKNNLIFDKNGNGTFDKGEDVKIGGSYLFRVGNTGNAIKLSTFFSAAEAGKVVDVKGVKIYNAANTDLDGKRSEISTSSGFWGKYTAASKWEDSTVQFGGTGVAIIVVETAKGDVEVAVEVVDGKNVTAASDFSGATNYIMLNNITWGTANKTAISGTIYGNGFAINAQSFTNATTNSNNALFYLNGGTIDNLVINGPVYPELIYQSEVSSSKPYYVMGVYTTGNATITNSYISGFRSPVMANGTSLYLENTTLVGGNYANLWLQAGKLTLKNVTTVQKETNATVGDTSKKVLGAGIIANNNINASNVTIIGDLTQYNWVSQSQASSYMDSDVSSLINTFFNNSTIAHTVGGTKYINAGIVFQGTVGTVNNASQTAGHGYSTQAISGSLMGVEIEGLVYTRTTTGGAVSSIPTYGGYIPNTQAALKPSFKHNVTLTDGVVNLKLVNGSATLTLPSYTVSKYSGQSIAVNITCPNATVNGNTITFSKDGTYTVTYTVEDNWFFKADGTKYEQNLSNTYTVTVVVIKAEHKDAVIDVSGVDKTIYYGLVGSSTDPDYEYCFAVLKGLKITDYNEDGTSFEVTVDAGSLPSGLTVKATTATYFDKVVTDSGVYYLVDNNADNNRDQAHNVVFTYTYTGKNGKSVTATVSHSITKNCTATQAYKNQSGGGCVTPDTLVMLADGTQKEIQHVTYEDQLLVWNFYTGEYETVPSAIIFNMGTDYFDVLTLNFDDGTTVKTINGHRFFDKSTNAFTLINTANVQDYVGHEFVKMDGEGYKTVKLVGYSVENEYTTSYSIMSACYYNFIVEGMLSDTFHKEDAPLFDYFKIGGNMAYDADQLETDIAEYGLYTYEDFADYLTYEQFVALNVQYMKISVEKGQFTYEGILNLIDTYLKG